jgi:hypothetical protein
MQSNVKTKSTTSSKRDAKTEDRYRALLRKRARTGQSLREFAEAEGIPAGTLAWWQHELRRRDRERQRRETPTFLPVQITSGGSSLETVPSPASAAESYEVVLGRGRVIRVSPKFDRATLTALVQAVEAASC